MGIELTLRQLQRKVTSLENKVVKLQSKSKDMIEGVGFRVYTKNYLNFQTVSNKSFTIKTLNNPKNALFFQIKVKFYNFSGQNVLFRLFADKVQIASEEQNFQTGIHEIIIYGTYQNAISDKIVLELYVNPRAKKQILVSNTTLTVWGDTSVQSEEYDAVETDEKYVLSYITNDRLYFKNFDKTANSEEVDFTFYEEAISHSICSNGKNVFLFRVDPNGNLFYCDTDDYIEKFITSNVSKISCCFYEEAIIFCYIKEGECYYGEIKNNIVISNKKITTILGTFVDCYLYFNNKNNKCFLVLTKKDNSNYLLENVTAKSSLSENINAEINLEITTSGEKWWFFHFIIN